MLSPEARESGLVSVAFKERVLKQTRKKARKKIDSFNPRKPAARVDLRNPTTFQKAKG